jgi:hypothetical protein
METAGGAHKDIAFTLRPDIISCETSPIWIRLQGLVADAALVVDLEQDVVVSIIDDLIDYLLDKSSL